MINEKSSIELELSNQESQQLALVQEEMRLALEAANLGYWLYDPVNQSLKCNRRTRELMSLPLSGEVTFSQALETVIAEDRHKISDNIGRALQFANKHTYDLVFRVKNRQTGNIIFVRSVGRAWFNEQKIAHRLSGTIQDTTEDVKLQQDLQRSEETLRIALEGGDLGFFDYFVQSGEVNWSGRTKIIFGFDGNAALTYDDMFGRLHPEDRERTKTLIQQLTMPGGSEQYKNEYRISNNDGGWKWVRSKGRIIYENGRAIRVTGTVADITEQKQAAEVITKSEARFRNIFETVPVSIWEEDFTAVVSELKLLQEKHGSALHDFLLSDLREVERLQSMVIIKDTNKASLTLFEAEKKEQLLGAVSNVFTEAALPVFARQLVAIANGETFFEDEYRLKTLKGKILHLQVSISLPVAGDYSSILISRFDITERKKAEQQLEALVLERTRQLQRSNEDLQQFAHVASHDLKEPVRKIRIFQDRIEDEFADSLPDKAKFYLAKMGSAADRMYHMIDGVLMYSSLGAMDRDFEKINLEDTIRNIESDLELLIEQKGAILHYSNLPVIYGAPMLIHQLFYNLINNSLKFSSKNQKPVVEIYAIATEASQQADGAGSLSGYKIVVQDNGIGFHQSNATNIFATFTRLNSKDKYEGTGLGLALCKKIVERHNGTIAAKAVEGQGAEFIVWLPG
jgi:PAS domain S-box-containing protein